MTVVVIVVVHARLSKYGVAAIEPKMPPTAFPNLYPSSNNEQMQTTTTSLILPNFGNFLNKPSGTTC